MVMKKKSGRKLTLSCYLRVSETRLTVIPGVRYSSRGGAHLGPTSVIELRGDISEPVKGRSTMALSIYMENDPPQTMDKEVPIGSIIGIRDEVQAVIFSAQTEFDHVWVLACSNGLRQVHLTFHEPYRGHARITSATFSSSSEKDD